MYGFMDYDDNEFLNAYDKNIELQVEEAIAASLVSNAIIKFMEDKTEWSGTATDMFYNCPGTNSVF